MEQINLKSTIEVSKNAHGAETGDEMVVMGVESGLYFGVNSVGATIWKEIQKPSRVDDVVAVLLDKFEVDNKICEQETLAFLKKLQERNLLIVSN